MNSPVVVALLPVVLLVAAGCFAGWRRWVRQDAVQSLSNLIFLLLGPALLFRAMSGVHVEELRFEPVAAYFAATGLIFAATLAWRGFNRGAAVLALANTYSNAVMIGIALVGLAFGPRGTVVMLTLISLHSLVLLTGATLVLELASAREAARRPAGGPAAPRLAHTMGRALRNAIIHPVVLPIVAGLLFARSGWTLPPPLDATLALLGAAFAPTALLLVGITLAQTQMGAHWRGALVQAVVKNILHPALVAALGLAFGLGGLPLQVMVVAAALPIGANVFLFSQRYRTQEAIVTTSVAISTALAPLTLSVVLALVPKL